jgi:hypothetical protein
MIAPTEEFAFNYPVGMGNCVTFKVEGKPIVIEKSMGFSQLESPRIERYRLIKEDQEPQKEETDLDRINVEIKAIWDEINSIKHDKPKKGGNRDKGDVGGDGRDE